MWRRTRSTRRLGIGGGAGGPAADSVISKHKNARIDEKSTRAFLCPVVNRDTVTERVSYGWTESTQSRKN